MRNVIRFLIYLLLCAALVFTYTACALTQNVSETETLEVNNDPITREMRGELLRLAEIPQGFEYRASEEDITVFKALRREILANVSEMTVSEYESYKVSLAQLIERAAYAQNGMPSIYIDSRETIEKSYVTASVEVVGAEGGTEAAVTATDVQIKTRGNSSNESHVLKKSYKLKFSEAQELLSLGKSKTWNLISNVYDKTFLRSKLAYDLAREIGVNAPDCTFVDVYLNGEYRGVYLLTETVSEGKTKVDIDLKNGDFLIELEHNPRWDRSESEGKMPVETSVYGMKLIVHEPELADISHSQKTQICDFLDTAEKALRTGDLKQIQQYFDVQSFIDYYIVTELFKNLDIAFSSTFFYVKDGIIFAGPVWDFDLSSGNVSQTLPQPKYIAYYNKDGYGTNTGNSYEGLWVAHMHHDRDANPEHYARYEDSEVEDEVEWYSAMLEVREIREYMYARYDELQPQICNLYEDNALGRNRIDMLIAGIYDSVMRNYNDVDPTNFSWGINLSDNVYTSPPLPAYEDYIDELRTWLKNRNEWLLWKFEDLN